MFRNRRVPNGTHGGVRGRLEVKLQSLYSIIAFRLVFYQIHGFNAEIGMI